MKLETMDKLWTAAIVGFVLFMLYCIGVVMFRELAHHAGSAFICLVVITLLIAALRAGDKS